MAQPGRLPVVAGYQIHEKIGEGGMGVVYRATQVCLNRPVAIKFLRPALNGESPLLSWPRESRLMAALAHPHVVAIHDSGQAEGQSYLVMEYVSGTSLRAAMTAGRALELARALPILDMICQALESIHEHGILHLDLKPENVLCGRNGLIKITDFGLSLPCLDARALCELGLARGSLDYCSPEQRHGLPMDQRSDVFSLATVAYELLTGRVPGRVYVPVGQHNASLPACVDDVLRRGLARDPDERLSSVAAFRQALHQACPLASSQWQPPSLHQTLLAPIVQTAQWLKRALIPAGSRSTASQNVRHP